MTWWNRKKIARLRRMEALRRKRASLRVIRSAQLRSSGDEGNYSVEGGGRRGDLSGASCVQNTTTKKRHREQAEEEESSSEREQKRQRLAA